MSTHARLIARATFVLAIIVAALVVPATAFAKTPLIQNQAPSLLGGVSPQRAFSESADGKAAMARLRTLQDEKTRAIDEKNRTLQTQEQTLAQTSSLLTEDARAQKGKELQKFRIDIERLIQDAQREFLGVQLELETAFFSKFQPAVAKVAKDKGFQLIFNLDTPFVSWFADIVDITPDVVKQLAAQ